MPGTSASIQVNVCFRIVCLLVNIVLMEAFFLEALNGLRRRGT